METNPESSLMKHVLCKISVVVLLFAPQFVQRCLFHDYNNRIFAPATKSKTIEAPFSS